MNILGSSPANCPSIHHKNIIKYLKMIKSVKIMQKYWPEISIQPVFSDKHAPTCMLIL